MKIVTTTIILFLTSWTMTFGQDGSDIRYFTITGIDSSIVGQFVHLDFYRRSFRGRTIDTVTINIDNRPILFKEIRKDTGFNNWFSDQHLQSLNATDGQIIRISKFKLESITEKAIRVTMFVDYYDPKDKLVVEKSRQIEYWFEKNIITEVLVKSKQL